MKIVIATGIYPPQIGGPATYSFLIKKELTARGFNVAVVSFGQVINWPKVLRHIYYMVLLAYHSVGAEIIYAQDPVSVGLPAFLWSKLTRKKIVIRVAGDYAWEQAYQRFGVKDNIDEFQNKIYDRKTELLRTVQRLTVKNADQVITPSDYFLKLVTNWGVSPDKIVRIYNGTELPPAGLTLRERKKFFISAGRLVPWKGFDDLIEIMPNFPDYRLLIVGDGPDYDRLVKIIYERGLQEQVSLTGSISREKLFVLLGEASIFLLNTSFESFSFQVVEAMASAVPVIATNVGSLPELVSDGQTGYLIKPGDRATLIEKVGSIIKDLPNCQAMVDRALSSSRNFSIKSTSEQLSRLLNNLNA